MGTAAEALAALTAAYGPFRRVGASTVLCRDGHVRRIHGSVPRALTGGPWAGRSTWVPSPYHDPAGCMRFWLPYFRPMVPEYLGPYIAAAWSLEPYIEQGTRGFPNWNAGGYSYFGGRPWSWLVGGTTIAAGVRFDGPAAFARQAFQTWRAHWSARWLPHHGGGAVTASLVPEYINSSWAYWVGHPSNYANLRIGDYPASSWVLAAGASRRDPTGRVLGMTDRVTRVVGINYSGDTDTWNTAIHEAFHLGSVFAGNAAELPGEESAARRVADKLTALAGRVINTKVGGLTNVEW